MGRNHVQIGYLSLYQCVVNIQISDHHLVQSPLFVIFRRKVQSGSGIGLRIGVNDEHLLLKRS